MNHMELYRYVMAAPSEERSTIVLEQAVQHADTMDILWTYRDFMVSIEDKVKWLTVCFSRARHDLSQVAFLQMDKTVQKAFMLYCDENPSIVWTNQLHKHPILADRFRVLKKAFLAEPLPDYTHLGSNEQNMLFQWLTHCTMKELTRKWSDHQDTVWIPRLKSLLQHYMTEKFQQFTVTALERLLGSAVTAAPNWTSFIEHFKDNYPGGYGQNNGLGESLNTLNQSNIYLSYTMMAWRRLGHKRNIRTPIAALEHIEHAVQDPSFRVYLQNYFDTLLQSSNRTMVAMEDGVVWLALWLNPSAIFQSQEWCSGYRATLMPYHHAHDLPSQEYFLRTFCKITMGQEGHFAILKELLTLGDIRWQTLRLEDIANNTALQEKLYQFFTAVQPTLLHNNTPEIELHGL